MPLSDQTRIGSRIIQRQQIALEGKRNAVSQDEIKMKRKPADLRVCACCEWIFSYKQKSTYACPKCQFGSYGAYWVYGDGAYRFAKTQEPWLNRKLEQYQLALQKEIDDETIANVPLSIQLAGFIKSGKSEKL